MLPAELLNWKANIKGDHLHLLQSLEQFGVLFSWRQIEKTLCWFEFRSVFAGRIIEHLPYEADGEPEETAQALILKTALALQSQGFEAPFDVQHLGVDEQWIASWGDVIEDPSLI